MKDEVQKKSENFKEKIEKVVKDEVVKKKEAIVKKKEVVDSKISLFYQLK